MINPKHIDKIVRRTLKDMGCTEPSVVRLVKGTMAYESGLEDLYDNTNDLNPKHGLCMMSKNRVYFVINDYMKFRERIKTSVEEATGVSIHSSDVDVLRADMEGNIALQAALLYVFFLSAFKKPPQDNLMEIAEFYHKYYYDGQYDPELVDNFVGTYRSFFFDKY